MKKALLLTALFASVPLMAAAQNLSDILQVFANFINALIPFFIALAVLFFIWGVFSYITAGDDAEKRKAGQGRMIYGIIAIFVIVSVWGLVNLLESQFQLDDTGGTAPDTPAVPTVPAP